jgi:hypothetical protein
MTQLENFIRAFSAGTGGCRRECRCGVTYYDIANMYDWDDGELERLEADKAAVSLEYSVSDIRFGGVEYVADCKCWHSTAESMMRYLECNGAQIAEYLSLEKKRKQFEADHSPIVK